MKRVTIILLCGNILLVLACGQNSSGSKTVQTTEDQTRISYPYVFINSKKEVRETDGSYNEMSLYTCGNNINADNLQLFCKSKKDSISDGYFHIITFFDTAKNAVFEEYPVTAGYMDDKNLKHIKAQYTYNTSNGYSKLLVYKENSLISRPIEYIID